MAFATTERSTGSYTATLKDETGTAVQLTDLDTLTITLFELDSKQIINSRSAQDALNANNVAFHATSGLLTWSAQASDTQCVTTQEVETHRAVFSAVWSTTKRKTWFMDLAITNIYGVS